MKKWKNIFLDLLSFLLFISNYSSLILFTEKIACTPTSSDSDPCTYRFCKANSDVCKLRIDFDTMVLTAPTTISSTGYFQY